MVYIENDLGKDEKVVYSAKVHWVTLIPHIFLMVVFIGFITLIPAIVRMFMTELVITNKKISGKTGLFKTMSMDSPLNKIQSIKVKQDIIGKILGYGDIIVTTASGEYNFKGIGKPNDFKHILNTQIDIFDEERISKQAQKIASGVAATITNNP
jgi:uncharacterized membrane protein YdbT with pleckstrin-like domain